MHGRPDPIVCTNCRAENSKDAVFCDNCGARLELICTGCGQTNRPGAKFCNQCGRTLIRPDGATPRTVERFALPESYTPKHLARKILASRDALEGERKVITVLFADLKGSLELLVGRDPEEARMLLDPVLERMMDAVHRYEGTVNQVMGDGIMALFGAPLAQEDHAVRACYAALVMQDSMKRYAAEVQRDHGIPLQIRVGLNSGEVIVRSFHSDLNIDYSAVGQTTHLASRMEQTAMPGSILMTGSTLRLVEGYVEVKPIGPVAVKGFGKPIDVYEAIGVGRMQRRLDIMALRGFSPFVGRKKETRIFEEALEHTTGGKGRMLAFEGEPGVGKSRLFWEFIHSRLSDGWLVLETASTSYGKMTSFKPVIDLLKVYFGIEEREAPRSIIEKVSGKIFSLDSALEPWIQAFLWLLDVPVDNPQWEQLEPPQRRQTALDGLKRLLFSESRKQPVLIMWENLHWIDPESQGLLETLAESLPTSPLLLLVNYRPEYHHEWGDKPFFRQVRIDPLPHENAVALVDALLGKDASVQPLKGLLIERTEGNPFFLEESVRSLVEAKALTGERGKYYLAESPENIEIPPIARAILAARIDRLMPEDKRILQAASIIGKDVPLNLLQAIAEISADLLRGCVDSLLAAEFFYEAKLFPELEYTFKHALSQEVAYLSLPIEKQKQYHGHLAGALEVLFKDRLHEKSEELAYHYNQSGNIEKALDYLIVSAGKADERFAPVESSRYYDEIMDCLDHLPSTLERDRQRIDLRLKQVDMLWVLGKYEEGWRILEENQKLAKQIDDQERLAQIHFQLGGMLYDRMDLDGAYAHHQECYAICRQLGTLEEMRRVYWGLGQSCRAISPDVNLRRTKAIEYHKQGLAHADAAATASIFDLHNAHFLWLLLLFQLGNWDEAMRYLLKAEHIARRLPKGSDVVLRALMKGSIGLSHLLKQQTETHFEMLRESHREAQKAGSHIYTTISRFFLGQGYFLKGDLLRALTHFEAAIRIIEKTENLFYPNVLLWIAETESRLGRLQEAMSHLRRYESIIETHGSIEGLAWFPSHGVFHRVVALIAQQQADPVKAMDHFGQSVNILAEQGYKPDLARTYLALGLFQQDQAQPDEARESLEKAATGFREMGFTVELNQTLDLF